MRASRLATATLVLLMSGSALVTAGLIGVQPAAAATPAAAPAAGVSITNSDVHGNAGDDPANPVTVALPATSVNVAVVVQNTGTDNLTGLTLLMAAAASDPSSTFTGLTCTFPDSSEGTTWAGPLLPGISFGCVASLSISQAAASGITATVNATGATTETAVTNANSYYAIEAASVTTTTTTTAAASAAATTAAAVGINTGSTGPSGGNSELIWMGLALVLLGLGVFIAQMTRSRLRLDTFARH
jgi:hypothetical protein